MLADIHTTRVLSLDSAGRILDWTPAEMEAYLGEYQLPNERTYYDPAKGDEKHECGLHAKLVTDSK